MGKLNHSGTTTEDNSDQTGACGQYSLLLIFPSQIFIQLWHPSRCVKVNRKDLCELLDTKWANGNSEALEEPMSMYSVRLGNFLQYPLVCLIQRFWQFCQNGPHTRWETLAQKF
jgi:hypothetical protein